MTEPKDMGKRLPKQRTTRKPKIISDAALRAAKNAARHTSRVCSALARFGVFDFTKIPQERRQEYLDFCEWHRTFNALWDIDRQAAVDLRDLHIHPNGYGGGPDVMDASWLRYGAKEFQKAKPEFEAKRAEAERAERERITAKINEQERLEAERAEQERLEAERAEQERWDSLSPEEQRREEFAQERREATNDGLPYLVRQSDMQHALPKLTWAIDGLIPEQGYCMLYGTSGHYKTYLALDIALSIGAGHDTWRDGRAINCSGYPVLYVASEGYSGLQGRVDAWIAERNDGIQLDNFLTLDQMPLVQGDGFDRLISQMRAGSDFYDLVVLDTVRGALGSELNERNPAAAPALKSAVDKIRYGFQCPVLLLHHTVKYGDDEAGTNAFRGDADAMLHIRSRKTIELIASKFRDAPRWTKPLRFQTRKVEGHDNIVLDCTAETPVAPETTAQNNAIDAALMQLEPGEYSLRETAKLIAPAVPFTENTLRQRKLPASKFYRDGKIVVPASEAG